MQVLNWGLPKLLKLKLWYISVLDAVVCSFLSKDTLNAALIALWEHLCVTGCKACVANTQIILVLNNL